MKHFLHVVLLLLVGLSVSNKLFASTADNAEDKTFTVDGIEYLVLTESAGVYEVSVALCDESTTGVIIPEEVKYEDKTYAVTTIGDYAFDSCYDLSSVKIPNSVTTIGESAFKNCYSLRSIDIPNSVKTISGNAFWGCRGLNSINIPNSVEIIDDRAFAGCSSLASVKIGNGLTEFNATAFSECPNLSEIVFAEDNPSYCSEDGIVYSKDTSVLVKVPVGKDLTSFSIPNSVTTIGSYALSELSLNSFEIPEGVTTIDEYAFAYCFALSSVTIPNSVKAIGEYAFAECSGLSSVNIPDGVTTIGNNAFSYCEKLTSVTIGSGLTEFNAKIFSKCPSLSEIIFAEDNPNYMSEDGIVYSKDMSVFVQLPLGKQSTSFSIPNSVTSIADNAFYGCSSLTSVEIPDGVKTIGEYAFYKCEGLSSIDIPDNTMTIGKRAFAECHSLASVTIGKNMQTIEERAFYYCYDIKSIYCYAATPPTTGEDVWYDEVSDAATLYVPEGTKSDYEAAPTWKDFSNIVETDFTGIESVAEDGVNVVVENGNIVVNGVKGNANMKVYNVSGQLVYDGEASTVNVPTRGIYIVRVAGHTFKLSL